MNIILFYHTWRKNYDVEMSTDLFFFARMTAQVRRFRSLQIVVICIFWLLGQGLVHVLHVPIPGGVVGMALVLAVLSTGKIQLGTLRGGAQWLLAEMLLFFVPMVLSVLNQRAYFGLLGLKILAVILIGTAAVMLVTALFVDLSFRTTVVRLVDG